LIRIRELRLNRLKKQNPANHSALYAVHLYNTEGLATLIPKEEPCKQNATS